VALANQIAPLGRDVQRQRQAKLIDYPYCM
jgi:hypothetical protein